MKVLKLVVITLLISSCSSVRVNYDYDKQIDFSSYKTYNYYSDLDTGLSDLDTNRLLKILDDALVSKGLRLSENPDFYINIQSSEYENVQRNTVGVGLGGGRNVGGGVSVGIPIGQSKLSRQIIFDFIDEKGKGLFWQAVTESNYNPKASPEKREANLNAVVDKIITGYPPKK